jgi:hypothetical protein
VTERKTQTSRKRIRIPKFESREEEAKFWDTHSFAEYWDEFKPVKVRFAKPLVPRPKAEGNLSEVLPIRFDSETLGKLRERAHKKGIGPTTLVRMWVIERLESK